MISIVDISIQLALELFSIFQFRAVELASYLDLRIEI